MSIPNWYEVLLLGLAAWRTFQLVALDSILDRPRRYVTGLGWGWKEGNAIPKRYREYLALFIECPYCAGFWIALAWWGAFQAWPHGTLVVAVPLVLSALVIAGARVLSSD